MSERGFKRLRQGLSDFVNRLRGKSDTSDQRAPSQPLPDEQMEQLIDKIAKTVQQFGMEQPAIFYVGLLKPFWPLILPTAYMSTPILDVVGVDIRDYVRLLENVDNIKRLEYRLKEIYEKTEP
ncbi:MAG: hypothetical protein JSV20_07780 [Candidatus Bathyarchaeota archaeon]|nr:MAG: hypothetical protein JSV20_07780 [Candidatus Bathyarchaeota archaeon]